MNDDDIQKRIEQIELSSDEKYKSLCIQSISTYCKTIEQVDRLIDFIETLQSETYKYRFIESISPHCKTKEQIDRLIALTETLEEYKFYSIESISPHCKTIEQIDRLIALTETLQSEIDKQKCIAICQKQMDKLTIQNASVIQAIAQVLKKSGFKRPGVPSKQEACSGEIGVMNDASEELGIKINRKETYTTEQQKLIQNKQKVMNQIKKTFQEKVQKEKNNKPLIIG